MHQNDVERLEWPPISPDLSCIEHLWDILGRAVKKRINQQIRLADAETSSPGMGCDSSDSNTETWEFNVEEAERVSGESWWIHCIPIISDRYCDFVIFDTQPLVTLADHYSWISDGILVLISVNDYDWIKFSCDVKIFLYLYLIRRYTVKPLESQNFICIYR